MIVMFAITRELLRLSDKRVVKNDCGITTKTTEYLKYKQFQDRDAIQCLSNVNTAQSDVTAFSSQFRRVFRIVITINSIYFPK